MKFTKEQIFELISVISTQKNGWRHLQEAMIEIMLKVEREFHLEGRDGDKANGYRPGHLLGNGMLLEFRIPRTRKGEFKPLILSIFRKQDEVRDRLLTELYVKGLSQNEASEIYESIYGAHYSHSKISMMLAEVRQDIQAWLSRPLRQRYPVIYVDCIHVKTRDSGTVKCHAFYVILAITPEGRREVISITENPQESAGGWKEIFQGLQKRGLKEIELIVADGIVGLDKVIAETYPKAVLQRCVTHLKRDLFAKVLPEDRSKLAADLREVFQVGIPGYTADQAWENWQKMCDKWKIKYKAFSRMRNCENYTLYMNYLAFHPKVQNKIYTTNWIERLNKDFRRTLKMRCSMPNAESVIFLMGSVAMKKKAYDRVLPGICIDNRLFPHDDWE